MLNELPDVDKIQFWKMNELETKIEILESLYSNCVYKLVLNII